MIEMSKEIKEKAVLLSVPNGAKLRIFKPEIRISKFESSKSKTFLRAVYQIIARVNERFDPIFLLMNDPFRSQI